MRLNKLHKTVRFNIRFPGYFESERLGWESWGSIHWLHKVDTWKMPKFERLFIDNLDGVSNPRPWRSINYWTLFIGSELRIYLSAIYHYFLFCRTIIISWEWIIWYSEHTHLDFGLDNDVSNVDDILQYNEFVHSGNPEGLVTDRCINFLNDPLFLNAQNELPFFLIWNVFKDYNFYALMYSIYTTPKKFLFTFSNSDFILSKNLRYIFKISSELNILNNLFKLFLDFKLRLDLHVALKHKFKDVYTHKTLTNAIFKIIVLKKKYIQSVGTTSKLFFFFKPLSLNKLPVYKNLASLLRKQKTFTKSKYSRSRQYCKNIVLFGLLLNIILMFGLNSNYYAILINSGYFIYTLYITLILYSLFIFIKYRLFEILVLIYRFFKQINFIKKN